MKCVALARALLIAAVALYPPSTEAYATAADQTGATSVTSPTPTRDPWVDLVMKSDTPPTAAPTKDPCVGVLAMATVDPCIHGFALATEKPLSPAVTVTPCPDVLVMATATPCPDVLTMATATPCPDDLRLATERPTTTPPSPTAAATSWPTQPAVVNTLPATVIEAPSPTAAATSSPSTPQSSLKFERPDPDDLIDTFTNLPVARRLRASYP